jgi:hypothetical protein
MYKIRPFRIWTDETDAAFLSCDYRADVSFTVYINVGRWWRQFRLLETIKPVYQREK